MIGLVKSAPPTQSDRSTRDQPKVRPSVAGRVRSVALLGLFTAVGYLFASGMLGRSSGDSVAPSATRTSSVALPARSSSGTTAVATAAAPEVSAELPRAEQSSRELPPAVCPDDMVLVDGWFCPILAYPCARYVDRREKYRCAEYARQRRCRGEPDHRRYCIDRYEWPNRVGAKPLVYVNWHEAKAKCQGVGKRLCRRSEWVLACEGPKRMPYPWGYVRQPSPCNIDRAPIAFDALAMEATETRQLELDRLWQGDRIGSHPDCVSSFGVYDLSGNVDEWTDNQADNPDTKKPSTLNGGYWGPVRDTCRLTTKSHGPKFRFYQVGFRCCRDSADTAALRVTGKLAAPRLWIEPERKKKRKKDDIYED